MNWLLFIIAAYVFLVLQTSLHSFLMIGGASPDFLLILLVFVGIYAPARVLGWAALILGLATDLQVGPMSVSIIGPATLGYLAGAYVILQLRMLVFRESLITFAVMVFIVGLAVFLVTVFMYSFRSLPWPLGQPVVGWSATEALVHRFFVLIYTMVLSLPVGYLLLRAAPWFGFTNQTHSRHHF